MATYVGLDARRDIEWIVPPDGNAMELFANGETDAFLGFPTEPQELRARHRPRDPEHGQRPAVVTVLLLHDLRQPRLGARAPCRDQAFLRAVFKAADFCQANPEHAARRLVDGGSRRSTTTPSRRSRSCPTSSGTSTI